MQDLDLEMESVLRRARAATEPSQGRVSRLLEGVQLELAGVGLADTDGLRPAPRRVPAPHPASLVPKASRIGAQLRFASWGALTAAAGFWFGIQYARGTLPFERAPSVPTLQAPTPVPEEPIRRAPAEQEPAPAAFPATTPSVAERVRGQSSASLDEGTRAAVRSSAASAVDNAHAERHTIPRHRQGVRPPEQLSFRQVLDRLRRAERAERNGAPELALALLDEIDQGAARTVLREERLLTRVLALCDQGDVARARQRARELAGAQNDSIYASRLRESCAATEGEP
jgi:hypothetical protein